MTRSIRWLANRRMRLWTRRHLHLPWLPIAEQTVVRAMGAAAVGTIRWTMTPATD